MVGPQEKMIAKDYRWRQLEVDQCIYNNSIY
jgi:hypothetical protein